jgi:aminoglycoside/choline kinase family phosphotransferase
MIGPDPRENRVYADLGERLRRELPLPRIYQKDLELGYFLLADLGEARLDKVLSTADPRQRVELLQKTAKLLGAWHQKALELTEDSSYFLYNPVYDRQFVLTAEWGYFLKGLSLLGLAVDSLELAEEGSALCVVPRTPKVYIHRDFQSRNLMLFQDKLWVLDWQGARLGPAAYDLASFLYDPYVSLSEAEKAVVKKAYLKKRPEFNLVASISRIAPLRLAQAIGAYSHLVKRGLPYGQYLAPALTRLEALLPTGRRRKGYPKTRALIAKALDLVKGLWQGVGS